MYYFKFDVISKQNILIYYKFYLNSIYFSGTSYAFSYYALSCQYMIDQYKNKLLTCFLTTNNNLRVFIFDIKDNELTLNKTIGSDFINIEYIHSAINSLRSKVLLSFYNKTGVLYSYVYNVNNTHYLIKSESFQYFNNSNSYCLLNYLGFNVYHYKNNGGFINSCLDIEGNLLVELYSEDLKIFYYKKIIINKPIVYGYSILYSNYTNNYYFISQEKPFILLFGNNEDLENIRNNFCLEDCSNTYNNKTS